MSVYFASKPHGHDSGIFYIDCRKQALFGLNLEAVTRMKRDRGHVSLMRDYFKGIEHVHNPGPREFQALREIIPLEMGLLEHPVRKHVVNPLLTAEEKLDKVKKLNDPEVLRLLQAWLRAEECLNESGAKYHLIGEEKWNEINRRRLPGVKTMSLKNHHLCHAFAAFAHSGYDQAVSVVIDGYGDGEFTTVYEGKAGKLTKLASTELKWSWGILYGWATRTLGYMHNEDEGKVEALAAFGSRHDETYHEWMKAYHIGSDLVIRVDDTIMAKYFEPNAAFLRRLADRIGAESLAASVQSFLEDKATEYVRRIIETTGHGKVVLSGGVAANVKMNQAVFEGSGLEELYVVPAMNDPGSTQGAAYLAAVESGEDISWVREQVMPYWGPRFSSDEVHSTLRKNEARVSFGELSFADAHEFLSRQILANKVIGLFQGAREFGPRALGNRSILANATGGTGIKHKLNTIVKRRERFQPFCPSILESERTRLFANSYSNKHMTCAFTLRSEHRESLGAITHVDHTARPQFVESGDNPLFYNLLCALKRDCGYGVVLNTSFNLHGRAMVLSPQDAVHDLCDCLLDGVWLDGFWVTRR